MDTPQFSKSKRKRQRSKYWALQITGFVVAVLVIAAIAFLLSAVDVWGSGNCPPDGFDGPFCVRHPTDSGNVYSVLADFPRSSIPQFKDFGGICKACCCKPDARHHRDCIWKPIPHRADPVDQLAPEPGETVTPVPSETPTPAPANPRRTPAPSSTVTPPPVETLRPQKPDGNLPAATPTPVPDSQPRDPFPTPPLAPEGPQTPADDDVAPEPTATPSAPPWRPECLLKHAGAPLTLCESMSKSGWWVYYLGKGKIKTGPYIPKAETMMAQGVTENELLWSATSPTTGKSVMVQWLGDEKRIRVVTYYAPAPHAWHKAYVFDILAGDEVLHREW